VFKAIEPGMRSNLDKLLPELLHPREGHVALR
jgi:hypothetical protein